MNELEPRLQSGFAAAQLSWPAQSLQCFPCRGAFLACHRVGAVENYLHDRDQVEIAIGDRFRMSPLGAARCPRLADREGVIVGGGQYPCTVRVIFDGSKSPTALHRDYVEPVE
jgi:hypothetical protein